MAEAIIYAWVALDDSKVLGLGLSPKTALENAKKRHADHRGYSARVRIDQFDESKKFAPHVAIAAALWGSNPITLTEQGTPEEDEDKTNVKKLREG